MSQFLTGPSSSSDQPFGEKIDLRLLIDDPDVVVELRARSEGRERTDFALAALRLGVLAIRQACGSLDRSVLRDEGKRLIDDLRSTLHLQSSELRQGLQVFVASYFDAGTGMLPQRLERLIGQDGEMQRMFRDHLSGDASTLAQTLVQHFGKQSPLFQILSPDQSTGLLASLRDSIKSALEVQRDVILREFSLDHSDSALTRFRHEITDQNGKLKKELTDDVAKVVVEFSLDNKQGALSRLVDRVETAHSLLADQFSLEKKESALSRLKEVLEQTSAAVSSNLTLDDEKSALSRLRQELLKVLEESGKNSRDFQLEVRASLSALEARRKEHLQSPRHGGLFEEAVGRLLSEMANRGGDLFLAVGNHPGAFSRDKRGDHVLELGPESAAAGAKIVFESKARQGYSTRKAKEEIEAARQNRGAQIGVFVFSKGFSPPEAAPFQRIGRDIFVVWDQDDASTDIVLEAAVSAARALCVRERLVNQRVTADLLSLEQSVAAVEKDIRRAAAIITSAQSARRSVDSIEKDAQSIREDLDEQLERLRSYVLGQRRGSSDAAA